MAGVEREGGLSKEALKLQPCADCLVDKPARATVGRKCVCMRGEPFARARAGMSEGGSRGVTNFVLESTERPPAGPRAVGSCAVDACGSSAHACGSSAHPNGSSSASKNSASSEESAESADGWTDADSRGTCSIARLQAVPAANPAVQLSAVVPVAV